MTPRVSSNATHHRFVPGPVYRDLAELDEPAIVAECFHHVTTARVVFANYALLQHDFPQLRTDSLRHRHPELESVSGPEAETLTRQIIDNWLLRNAAFISVAQSEQDVVNSPIDTSGPDVLAYRPPLYGRACITRVANCRAVLPQSQPEKWADEPDGLLDIKGVGIPMGIVPAPGHHTNGLLALGDALTNVLFQEVINLIFRRAGTEFWTVPEYGLLDLGFDVKNLYGEVTPAGLQIRRAHSRPRGGAELPDAGTPEQQVKVEIEMLLRHYGLTSCNPTTSFEVKNKDGYLEVLHGGRPVPHTAEQIECIRKLTRFSGEAIYFDGINVQLTREVSLNPSRAQVVDFGHYSAQQRFDNPVLSLVRKRPLRWGGSIRPDNPFFVAKPAPELCLAWNVWGVPAPGDADYQVTDDALVWSRPFVKCFALADQFRQGAINGDEVRRRLDTMIENVAEKWDCYAD